MPKRAIFPPTYRLVVLSVLVGVIGAGVALAFEALVELAQDLLLEGVGGWHEGAAPLSLSERLQIPRSRWWLPVTTTLGGLLSGFLVYRFAPEAEGHGTDAAIEAYHLEAGELRARVPLVKAVASALVIGSGGVAGREGPAAQISSGLGGLVARWTGLRGLERRSLLLASMAAGLAAMFRAPLGMALFSVEILYSGMAFEAEVLIYTVIAAVASYAAFGFVAGWQPLFDFPTDLVFEDPMALPGFALLGLVAGVAGALLPPTLYRTRALFRRLPGPPHLKPALGGLILGLVAVVVPESLGAGYEWVEAAVENRLPLTVAVLILLCKAPGMALTIGSGGSGGAFGPTVVMGGLLGAVLGRVLAERGLSGGMPTAAFVVVGMAAVFAGCGRTPLSTLVMVVEMTRGYGLIVPAMLATMLAFLVQRSLTESRPHPKLYESQVESPEHSPLHHGVFVRRGLEILDQEEIDLGEVRLPKLVNLLRYGDSIPVAGDQASLVSLSIEPGSKLDGASVAAGLGAVAEVTAVAILRGDEMQVPRGDSRLLAGDTLLAVTKPAAIAELEALTRGHTKEQA
jgi:CIC family chloride channel protein